MTVSEVKPKGQEFTPNHDQTDDDEVLKWLDLGDTALGKKRERKPAEPLPSDADLEKSDPAE